jgi:hypothetical protein
VVLGSKQVLSMNLPLQGGCACGDIRFECAEPPVFMLNCHCRNCQRAGGSAFSSSMIFERKTIRMLSGQPKGYDKIVESGNTATQCFCARCGSPLYMLTSGNPEYIGIRALSLDDPSCFKAEAEAWVCDAQPWVCMDAAVPKLDKSPEEI